MTLTSELEAELDETLSKLESYVKKYGPACNHTVYLRRRMLGAAKEFPAKYAELCREFDAHSREKNQLAEKIVKAEKELDALFSRWNRGAE